MYTHIVHLADIHIKDDMDEYINVFDTLFKTIINSEYPKPLIVIAGDVIDNRRKITPEVIKQTIHLLNGLSDIGTTIVIDGNHDITENNHIDTRYLEVITSNNGTNSSISNLHYLSKSGYYHFNNVTIAFSSLVDSSTDILPYPTDTDTDADTDTDTDTNQHQLIIGLGHFPVEGTINSTSERVIKLSKFNKYPLVLLGDIHKARCYGSNCYYAGSLIAQNHGEEKELHGYMEHDITNANANTNANTNANIISRHIPIHNDTQYVTISINKKGNIVKPKCQFTKYTKLRLKAIDPKIVDIMNSKEDYKVLIEQTYNTKVIRLITNIKHMSSYQTLLPSLSDIHVPTDEEIISSLMTDNKSTILDLHRLYRQRIGMKTQHTSTKRWYIKTLTFENMLSYTSSTTIDLQSYANSITGIIGRNASGKSNLLKIISFALFGEMALDYADEDYTGKKITGTSKIVNKHDQSHILNSTKRSGHTSITISLGDIDYTINRRYIRTSANAIKTEVTIKTSNGDHMANNKTSAAEYLRRYVKRSASFLTYNVTDKSISGNLLTIEPKDRASILSNTLDLTVYNTLAVEVSTSLSSIRSDIRDLKTRYDTIYAQIKNQKDLIDHTMTTNNIDEMIKKRDRLCKRRTNDIDQSTNDSILNVSINDYNQLTELRSKLKHIEQIPQDILSTVKPLTNDDDPRLLLETYYRLRSITNIDMDVTCMSAHTHEYTSTDPDPDVIMPIIPTKRIIKPKYELDHTLLIDMISTTTNMPIDPTTCLSHYIKIRPKRPTIDESVVISSVSKYKGLIKEAIKSNASVDHVYDIVEDMAEDIAKIKIMKQDMEYNASIDNDIKYNNDLKRMYQQRERSRQVVNGYIDDDIMYNKMVDLYEKTLQHHIQMAITLKKTKQDLYENMETAVMNCNVFRITCQKARYYQQQLVSITDQLASINQQVDRRTALLDDKISVSRDKIRITKLHDQTTELMTNVNKLQREYVDLNEYHVLLTKKGGIKDTILKHHLSSIATSINKILSTLDLVNFTVSFSNSNSNGIDMWIHKTINANANANANANTNANTITLHPKQLSGYESLILNIIIKIQLNLYNERGMAEIFFIDEGLDVIDQYNMPKFITLLNYMKQIYKNIFIITHMDDEHIRSKIERVIEVQNGILIL